VKRGLVVLDPAETPPGELDRRVGELQAELRRRGLAAALVYADVYHSGDVTYLSNICLYWNESVLAVPADGRPALLTKLSRRVHPWMRATSNLEDLRSGPVLAALAQGCLAGLGPGGAGLAEMDWWPDKLVDDLAAALPGRELADLGSVVRRRRQSPSPSEAVLLRQASQLTARAVNSALDGQLSNPERAGRAELTARLGGAEDVNVYCRPSTAGADTVEVVCEYRGYWTSAARVLAKDRGGWADQLARAYQAAASALAPGVTAAQVRRAATDALAPLGLDWRADLIHHTDLETEGGYRYPRDAAQPLTDGSVVTLRLELALADGSDAVLADTFQIRSGTPSCLTSSAAGPVISAGAPAATR
jgi:Xaa-Pro aminopeptidase